MSWKFKYLEEFLTQYKKLPKWRRKLIRDHIKMLKKRVDPIKGFIQGKLARYPLHTPGNQLLAKVNFQDKIIAMYHIQVQ